MGVWTLAGARGGGDGQLAEDRFFDEFTPLRVIIGRCGLIKGRGRRGDRRGRGEKTLSRVRASLTPVNGFSYAIFHSRHSKFAFNGKLSTILFILLRV